MISRREFERKASWKATPNKPFTTDGSVDRLTAKVREYCERCHERRQNRADDQIRQAVVDVVVGIGLPAPEVVSELFEVPTTFPRESVGLRPTREALRLMKLPSGWPTCEGGIE